MCLQRDTLHTFGASVARSEQDVVTPQPGTPVRAGPLDHAPLTRHLAAGPAQVPRRGYVVGGGEAAIGRLTGRGRHLHGPVNVLPEPSAVTPPPGRASSVVWTSGPTSYLCSWPTPHHHLPDRPAGLATACCSGRSRASGRFRVSANDAPLRRPHIIFSRSSTCVPLTHPRSSLWPPTPALGPLCLHSQPCYLPRAPSSWS